MFGFLDQLNQQWAVKCYQDGTTKRPISRELEAEKKRLLAEQKERLAKLKNLPR